MDTTLRELERAVEAGDHQARHDLVRARLRAGLDWNGDSYPALFELDYRADDHTTVGTYWLRRHERELAFDKIEAGHAYCLACMPRFEFLRFVPVEGVREHSDVGAHVFVKDDMTLTLRWQGPGRGDPVGLVGWAGDGMADVLVLRPYRPRPARGTGRTTFRVAGIDYCSTECERSSANRVVKTFYLQRHLVSVEDAYAVFAENKTLALRHLGKLVPHLSSELTRGLPSTGPIRDMRREVIQGVTEAFGCRLPSPWEWSRAAFSNQLPIAMTKTQQLWGVAWQLLDNGEAVGGAKWRPGSLPIADASHSGTQVRGLGFRMVVSGP